MKLFRSKEATRLLFCAELLRHRIPHNCFERSQSLRNYKRYRLGEFQRAHSGFSNTRNKRKVGSSLQCERLVGCSFKNSITSCKKLSLCITEIVLDRYCFHETSRSFSNYIALMLCKELPRSSILFCSKKQMPLQRISGFSQPLSRAD